jgi:uncharacterized caspase-like protein
MPGVCDTLVPRLHLGVGKAVAASIVAAFLAACWTAFFVVTPAAAQESRESKRVAFVIGNSAYTSVDHLRNPVEDAAGMQVALQRMKFKIVVGLDLNLQEFKDRAAEFSKLVKGADVALLFYAGHGVQFRDQNYLLPIDIEVTNETDVIAKSIALNAILDDMARNAKASVVFLDACRDSPQFRSLTRAASAPVPAGPGAGTATQGAASSIFSFSRGLARVSASSADRFVGYAAAPNMKAEDGRGKNSPFTTALLRHIATPDVEIGYMFNSVRREVMAATRDRQQPEALIAMRASLMLNPTGAVALAVPQDYSPPPPEDGASQAARQEETDYWIGILNSRDPKDFEDYLKVYPKGRYALPARRKIEELKPQVAAATPQPSPVQTPAPVAPAPAAATAANATPPPAPATATPPPSSADVAASGTGIARISATLSKDEAQRNARTLARANAILSKLPVPGITPAMTIETSAEAVDLLRHLGRGIPYEEAWTSFHSNPKEVKVELKARVHPLTSDANRKLSGAIEPAEIISGKNFKLRVDAKKEATIGIFAWQANGKVVRLYPESTRQQVVLKAGQSVTFPRANDAYPALASATLPGERSNHEAILVITGARPLAFEALVQQSVTRSAQQSANEALDDSVFFNNLAATQDPELEILVLPYVVRAEK